LCRSDRVVAFGSRRVKPRIVRRVRQLEEATQFATERSVEAPHGRPDGDAHPESDIDLLVVRES